MRTGCRPSASLGAPGAHPLSQLEAETGTRPMGGGEERTADVGPLLGGLGKASAHFSTHRTIVPSSSPRYSEREGRTDV